jgi:hypothetical protein
MAGEGSIEVGEHQDRGVNKCGSQLQDFALGKRSDGGRREVRCATWGGL